MKRVSPTVFYGRPKGVVRPDLQRSKYVCKQLEPVYGSQLANTRQHVFELEWFREITVSAGGVTRLAHFDVAVGTHD
jgi:hypothetical protein